MAFECTSSIIVPEVELGDAERVDDETDVKWFDDRRDANARIMYPA